MQRHVRTGLSALLLAAALILLAAAGHAADAANPFLGRWALTIPGGAAGWLGVEQKDGALAASILWGGGSVLPVTTAKVEGDKLVLTRVNRAPGKKKGGKGLTVTETITATVQGDAMALTTSRQRAGGKPSEPQAFTGKRIPDLPPAPDLAKVKFGEPVQLFNGKDLTGWKLMSTTAPNGWSVKDGVLVNHAPQEEGKPHKSYANIQTEKTFGDFRLTLDVNVPAGSNSGIYLKGIYEIQVTDSYGKPLDPHNMGALYSRITPAVAAEKPAGEWQTYDITLVDRHLTVILNGKTIIDNQPVLGCTGGALWSDESKDGPIYLQGDHSDASYKNIVLRPVVK